MASDLNPIAAANAARGLQIKSTNPKDILAVNRVPLWLIPPTAKVHQALGHLDGAIKYGPYNWRDEAVSYMQYVSAAQRHLDDIIDGEDYAHDSQVHHAAHAIATLNIILDAMALGNLIDDRPTAGVAPLMHLGAQPFISGELDFYLDTPAKIETLNPPEYDYVPSGDNAAVEGGLVDPPLSEASDGELADEVMHRGLDLSDLYRPD